MDINKPYKNPRLEARRQALLKRQRCDALLHTSKANFNNPRSLIQLALNGQVKVAPQVQWPRTLCGLKLKREERVAFDTLLLAAEERSKLLDDCDRSDENCILGLAHLARWRGCWIRSLETWSPRTHNRSRQFSSLLRHLLAQFDVPAFMDRAFTHGGKLEQCWFTHICSGRNIRTALDLPIPLTKKMAHHFLQAPADATIVQALRWGQVLGLGGSERLARTIIGGQLGRAFHAGQEEFWSTVLNFFIQHPMIDPHQLDPMIDYLNHQRFIESVRLNEAGMTVAVPPPQPNLSMKGRTPEAILRQVQAWHRALRRDPGGGDNVWLSCGIPGYDRVEGVEPNHRRFRIIELLSSGQLRDEGRAMRHCVATYALSCKQRRCAIYSMTEDRGQGPERRLTIEVNLQSRQVVQARGKFNAPSTPLDQRVLSAWVSLTGLQLSRYALLRAW